MDIISRSSKGSVSKRGKKSCAVCGERLPEPEMRSSSRSLMINGILVACLTGYGYVERLTARDVFEQCCLQRKYLCHDHFVQAAHFICEEMAVVGKHYTCFHDNTSGAYVTLGDIPPHVVTFINGVLQDMKRELVITAKYVWIFMNDALRRYYATPLWVSSREAQTPYERISAYNETKGKELLSTPLQQSNAIGVKHEVIAEDEFTASTSSPHIKHAGEDSDLPYASISSRALHMMPLGQTDPVSLHQYYFVQGDLLMNLFRFCPECGNRVAYSQLTKVGTAAVVKYLCTVCLEPKQWESQQCTIDHTTERTFRGNVAASAAAISAGFGYEDIRRWTSHFNLSLFTKSLFWEVFEWTRPR
uniref:CxC5 domain-containing protein n=1 Tax=Haemonchus contortus TaxID=6289 RepID=U6PJH9_HAECO|nr:unnamed protein product [Haemonchus contortus]CDJ93653.1 unnamed protein product [Haemonchus contortus]CDJ93654.1 unnamed protein product [Haemonchus contortus]